MQENRQGQHVGSCMLSPDPVNGDRRTNGCLVVDGCTPGSPDRPQLALHSTWSLSVETQGGDTGALSDSDEADHVGDPVRDPVGDPVGDNVGDPVGTRRSRISHRLSMSVAGITNRIERIRLLPLTGRRSDSHRFVVAIRATLVDGEVIEAQVLRFWNPKRKMLAGSFLIAVLLVGILLGVYIYLESGSDDDDYLPEEEASGEVGMEGSTSFSPSSSPLIRLQSTLDVVRSRGSVRCGFVHLDGFYSNNPTNGEEQGIALEMCRAVSAVILGDSSKILSVPLSFSDRYLQLRDGDIDVLLAGSTHTLEQEVRESTTNSGFAFSVPYYYDGVTYSGNETYVTCAFKKKRFGECSDLSICIIGGTAGGSFSTSLFPPSFLRTASSVNELYEAYFNGTCNVIASERSVVTAPIMQEAIHRGEYHIGNFSLTKEPFAAVTRNDDRQWSDIVNWVIQALFFGEEHGLSQNSTLCQSHLESFSNEIDLHFLNGVYCVGNYGDIFRRNFPNVNRGMNDINRGTGILYALPFGNMLREDVIGPDPDSLFGKVIERGMLHCGVFTRRNFAEYDTETQAWFGMDVDYCHTLAAAIFHGNGNAVDIIDLTELIDSYYVFENEEVDVIVGGKVDIKYDLGALTGHGGVTFSTPYYYSVDNERGNVFAIVTPEGDPLFSSFVNAVVLATFHADEVGISLESSVGIFTEEIPLVSIFGSNLRWALRDAIFYSGSYSDMCNRNLMKHGEEVKGRNQLNLIGEPQLLCHPGLL